MAQNPVGYVNVADGGAPRIISGYSRQALSGGQFGFSSGAAATALVSSGLSSFETADILVAAPASGGQFTGIVLNGNVGSNEPVALATRGMFILRADGDVVPGQKVMTQGGHAVAALGSVAGNLAAARSMGRAVTGAGSEGFCIVDIHG